MGDDYITPYADESVISEYDIVTTSGTGEGFTPGGNAGGNTGGGVGGGGAFDDFWNK